MRPHPKPALDYDNTPAPPRTKRTLRSVGFGLAMAVIACLAVPTVSLVRYARTQRHNLRRAKQHIPLATAAISGDERFRFVRFEEYTGQRGSLGVFGCVRSAEDLKELWRRVDSTSPPVPVSWHVEVILAATRPASQ